MQPTYLLARDYLQRAVTVLRGADSQSRQLRSIIERTIVLMDETCPDLPRRSNVLDFVSFRERYFERD